MDKEIASLNGTCFTMFDLPGLSKGSKEEIGLHCGCVLLRSTSGPLLWQRTFTSSGLLAPPFSVSLVKISLVSAMPLAFCVFVAEPWLDSCP